MNSPDIVELLQRRKTCWEFRTPERFDQPRQAKNEAFDVTIT